MQAACKRVARNAGNACEAAGRTLDHQGAVHLVSPDEDRPTLVLNPPDDRDFEAFVTSVVDSATEAAQLERSLRLRYPRAIVRPRDLAGERVEIWYVYRDGHWVRPGTR